MKRVYTVMVADLFHCGHVEFLRRARKLGDYLIVGLVSDENAAKRKRKPILTWEERKRVVQACRYVDEVWLHRGPLCNEFMQRNKLDLTVYASRDEVEETERLDRYRRNGLDRRYIRKLAYTREISTSKILQRIAERHIEPPSPTGEMGPRCADPRSRCRMST